MVVAAAVVVGPLGGAPASAAPGSFTVDDGTDARGRRDRRQLRHRSPAPARCGPRSRRRTPCSAPPRSASPPASTRVSLDLSGAGGAEVGDLDIAGGNTVRLIGNQMHVDRHHAHQGRRPRRSPLSTSLPGARLELDLVALADGSTDRRRRRDPQRGPGPDHEPARVRPAPTWRSARATRRAQVARSPTSTARASRSATSRRRPSRVAIDFFSNTAGTVGGAISNLSGTVVLEGNSIRCRPRRLRGRQHRGRRRRRRAQHHGQRHARVPGVRPLLVRVAWRRRVQQRRLADLRRWRSRRRQRHRWRRHLQRRPRHDQRQPRARAASTEVRSSGPSRPAPAAASTTSARSPSTPGSTCG